MIRLFQQRRHSKRSSRLKRSAGTPDVLESRELLSAVTMQFAASEDTTIYETGLGNLSNGAGQYLVVGGENSDELARRGLIGFDLSSASIPQGSVIVDATLTMNLAYSFGDATDIELFRVTNGWGEAGSDAPGIEIDGAAAQQFDATWLFSHFAGSAWTNPGGDFLAGSSGSVRVQETGAYQWIGEGLINDVQHWLDNASQNFGWLLMAQQVPGSVKAFESRDSPLSVLKPTLEITYETPVLPTIIAGRSWSDSNADGLRVSKTVNDLQLGLYQNQTLFNTYGGNEYWFLSATNRSWYFLPPSGELTRWDGQKGSLTGQSVEGPDPRLYFSPESLLGTSTSVVEPFLNGVVVQLLDQNGSVVATTVSGNRDLDQNGTINPETESGWYQFDVTIPGQYSIRATTPDGLVESATLHSARAAEVFQLKSSLGLHFLNSYYENVGFRGERWLKAAQGWVFITPAGDLYRWSGRSGTAQQPVTGTWLASLGQSYYRDPSLIFQAGDPGFAVTDQSALAGAAFGFYQTLTIQGRSWHDTNGDGIRSPAAFSSAQHISPPQGAPGGNFIWFQVTDPVSAQISYFYASGTRLFEWVAGSGSSFVTEIWGGAALSAESIRKAVFTPEAWLNGTPYELLDEKGYVVALTVSANRDQNNDGQTNPETESGWYAFAGLLPGSYRVREAARNGWLTSTPISAPTLVQQSQTLQQQLGFRADSQDWYNFGRLDERWFRGQQNEWYFIVPNGTIYRWDNASGGQFSTARGTRIARLSASFYVNIEMLFDPREASIPPAAGQSQVTLNFGTLHVIDSLFSELSDELLTP